MPRSNLARALSAPPLAESDLELLLPWYATGVLDGAESRRIASALASDSRLAHAYAAIQREQSAIAGSTEQPEALSLRPLIALFAAIEMDMACPANVVSLKLGCTTRYAPEDRARSLNDRGPPRDTSGRAADTASAARRCAPNPSAELA